jgi:hypothetical protein
VGFDRYAKTTRRAAFLAEMERVVPWLALCGLIKPVYPKVGNGRPPVEARSSAVVGFESFDRHCSPLVQMDQNGVW